MPILTAQPVHLSRTLSRWCVIHAVVCIIGVLLTLFFSTPVFLAFLAIGSFSTLIAVSRGAWTPSSYFGPANWITLGRLIIISCLLFLPHSFAAGIALVVLSIGILILDGFDGSIARKHKLSSEFGEYFDKESDAFFMLVLCVAAYTQGILESWILIPGLLRYAFVLVLFFLNPGHEKEYRSNWARIIYVVMISCLLSVFVLPAIIHLPAVVIATIALLLSFAHYFRWLIRERFKQYPLSNAANWAAGIGSFLVLNSILLLPSLLTSLETSSFFPIPDPSQPTTTLTWTRGWYDYVLYFFIRRPNQDLFRICADLVVILTLYVLLPRSKRTTRWLTGIFMALLAYEAYDAIAFSFFHRRGLIYEDAQYVLNLYYLFIDTISAEYAFRIIGLISGIVILAWILPPLFRKATEVLTQPPLKWLSRGITVSLVPIVAFIMMWFGPSDERPTVRTITGKMVANYNASKLLAQTLAEIETLPLDSTYFEYDAENLTQRPNLVVFMIESYGRILIDDPYLKVRYDSLMHAFDLQFQEAGFSSASRTSVSPVSGGLSWLSMNTLFSGLHMANRTFYTRYLSRIDQYPHMIRLLQNAGYHTITLQPPNRPRPGLALDNYYNFDQTVFFEDLNYSGSPYSIWIIPDQYSLEFTHENFLKTAPSPFFFFFETATTHAPWTNLPPYVDNWQTLNTPIAQKKDTKKLSEQIQTSIQNRFMQDTPDASALYWKSMHYDLRVIRDYIVNHAPENTLVLILGDHQPPLLPSSSYETPIHVLSREQTLIDRFTSYGFEPGMVLVDPPSDPLLHAGVYSMLIDVLSAPLDSLPTMQFRPSGIPPSILTTP